MGDWAGIVPWEGEQALAQGAQRSCGCSWIPGSAQGQAGHWGLEQPGIVEGIPVHAGVQNEMGLKVPSNPNHFGILRFLEAQDCL